MLRKCCLIGASLFSAKSLYSSNAYLEAPMTREDFTECDEYIAWVSEI
jgi:hypothetical protein